MDENKTENLSLSQFCDLIKLAINQSFQYKKYWIIGEIANLNNSRKHCYLTMVEKDSDTGIVKAEIKGMIWETQYKLIDDAFNKAGIKLKEGQKILFSATINYSNIHGLSLIIDNIKPEFTLGLILLEKQKTIQLLKANGEYFLNKEKEFPLVAQNIAIISAEDSRGYHDFIDKLLQNKNNIKFRIELFSASLQGEEAANSIKQRLIEIYQQINKFDVVVIIRGGGGNVNLDCFNDYKLARAVARFPIPIITGIGHAKDILVIDEVAFKNCLTPTDAAVYLISKTFEFKNYLNESLLKIEKLYKQKHFSEQKAIQISSDKLHALSNKIIANEINKTQNIKKWIKDKSISVKNNHKFLLQNRQLQIKNKWNQIFNNELNNNEILKNNINHISKNIITAENKENQAKYYQLKSELRITIQSEKTRNILNQEKMNQNNPLLILEKGYAFIKRKNKIITSVDNLKTNDVVDIVLKDGQTKAIIK